MNGRKISSALFVGAFNVAVGAGVGTAVYEYYPQVVIADTLPDMQACNHDSNIHPTTSLSLNCRRLEQALPTATGLDTVNTLYDAYTTPGHEMDTEVAAKRWAYRLGTAALVFSLTGTAIGYKSYPAKRNTSARKAGI